MVEAAWKNPGWATHIKLILGESRYTQHACCLDEAGKRDDLSTTEDRQLRERCKSIGHILAQQRCVLQQSLQQDTNINKQPSKTFCPFSLPSSGCELQAQGRRQVSWELVVFWDDVANGGIHGLRSHAFFTHAVICDACCPYVRRCVKDEA